MIKLFSLENKTPPNVNLDSKTRLQTEADLSNPTVNTLENAQKRIQALMEKDSYRRFLRSEVYLTMLKEARETAKAAATAALAASLQEASDELDEPVFQLVHSTTYTSPFSFLSTFGSTFSAQNTPSLTLPGVAAAAAKADAGLNNIQDLQLLEYVKRRSISFIEYNNKHNTVIIMKPIKPYTDINQLRIYENIKYCLFQFENSSSSSFCFIFPFYNHNNDRGKR
ncbi:unnamed protein product [Schistosoma curassoni]|uniref:RGS domain-containing protein n=1 Tax=Schistosoma curassoni TaxID=6186 RepID=A0A183KNT4_9TREM|nr:unnamed protein product [Schistosoma curassoni]